MDKIVNLLTNKYLVAIVVGFFLLGLVVKLRRG